MNKKICLCLLILTFAFIPFVYALEDNQHNETAVNTEEDNLTYINEKNSYEATIVDTANLLTKEEKEKLLEEMIPLTNYGNIVFFSTNTNSSSAEYYAEAMYHSFYGSNSGTLLLIDIDHNDVFVYSDGSNQRIITKVKAYSLVKKLSSYISKKNYYDCASVAFSQINTLLDGGMILEPLRYLSSAFIALTLSFLFSFLLLLYKYNNKVYDSEIVEQYDVHHTQGKVTAEKTGIDVDNGPHYNHLSY